MANFKDLIYSVSDLLVETSQRESSQVDGRMKKHGYGNPQPGAGGHVTFTRQSHPNDQMLVDVPGNEWHHMIKGVINQIGDLKDDSLETYLDKEKD